MCESTLIFFEFASQIQPPCREEPGDRYGMQLTGWDMYLASVVLATFTAMNQGVNIRNGLAHKCVCSYVAAANSRVDVLKDGTSIFW
jgi:hypothetical protein